MELSCSKVAGSYTPKTDISHVREMAKSRKQPGTATQSLGRELRTAMVLCMRPVASRLGLHPVKFAELRTKAAPAWTSLGDAMAEMSREYTPEVASDRELPTTDVGDFAR